MKPIALIILIVTFVNSGTIYNINRTKRFLPSQARDFLIKYALTHCKIPNSCLRSVEHSLLKEIKVAHCPEVDFHTMLNCLDYVILTQNDMPSKNLIFKDLNSIAGSICCETIENVSESCRAACRGALYAPTLSAEKKQNRIYTICDKTEGTPDNSVLRCLATTPEWLHTLREKSFKASVFCPWLHVESSLSLLRGSS